MISPTDAVFLIAQSAVAQLLDIPSDSVDPVVRDSQFADLQLNAALALARRHGRAPIELAQQIAERLVPGDVIAKATASQPGYVNVFLADAWIAREVMGLSIVQRNDPSGRRVVIDYSSPNVAKEMHVGHLRTTVVGDALARMKEWLGDEVIRQNHIGDWGTPFGMLIEHFIDVQNDGGETSILTESPNTFYQAARGKFDSDADFAQRARTRVVALQAGDPGTITLWGHLVKRSKDYFNQIYAALGVSLTDADLAGESSYNSELAALCEDLEVRGLARISHGALCAFPQGFTGRDGNPAALIIRKGDGGYGYATTDLATVRHRSVDLHADSIVYVVGTPQELHLEMVWQVAREAGWVKSDTELTHVKIGNVLGSDNKILRTRSGESFKLLGLLEEATARARAVLDQTGGVESEEERQEVARMIGVGAVKYADLSVSHETEYVFDLDRMVSLTGNTGPYLQYAIVRIRSVLDRAASDLGSGEREIRLYLPEERALAISLLGFDAAVRNAADLMEPHRLCAYLFGVAQRFSSFYDAAPVLKAEADIRGSRLALCRRTVQVLERGLAVLGIPTPRRM